MLRLGKRNHGSWQKRVSAGDRGWRIASLIFTGLLLAGCSVNGVTNASLSPRGGTTVAFESIDGLPRGQFQKLVKALTEEADARQIAVVTRESSATFRARGYASAHLRGKQTMIAWVWDIYDADKQRAVRISGEEKATSAQRGWPAADDATLKRIARDSIDQLAAFLASPGQPAPAPAPQAPSDGVVVADGLDAAVDAARPASKPTLDRTADAGWRQQTAARSSIAAYSGVSPR
jgi:hypothetical protein